MYTLGGGINEEQGWGRAERDVYACWRELAAYGVGPDWFGLGDRDFATHIVRTRCCAAGYPLSAVTTALCERWQPGVTLLPMSDDRVRDPRGARRRPGRADRALPGVVGAAARGRARRARSSRSARPRPSPRPGVLDGDRRRRRRAAAAVQPGGQHRHHPGRARDRRGGQRRDRSSGSPRSSAARRCAAWPTPAWPRSACRPPRRRWPRTTAPGLLDGWLVDEQDKAAADAPELAGITVRARAAAHDRPRGHRPRSPGPRSTWPRG